MCLTTTDTPVLTSETMYSYDSMGTPNGAKVKVYSGTTATTYEFFFRTNIQGDVLAIFDRSTKAQVVSFNYDAWGNYTTTVSNATLSQIALNYTHLRYRGYYQDAETGLYYLNSRYYDAKMCRFINADSFDIIGATPDGLTDKNLYAYCDNNPIMRIDDGGEFWLTTVAIGALVGAAIGFVSEVATQLILEGEVTDWSAVGKSTLAGGITGAIGAATGGVAIANPIAKKAIDVAVGGVCNVITDVITEKDVNVLKSFAYGATTSLLGSFVGDSVEKINIKKFNSLNRTQKKNTLTSKVFKCKQSLGNVALRDYYGTTEFQNFIKRGTYAASQAFTSSVDFLVGLF